MITLSVLQTFLDSYLNFDLKLDIARIDPYMTNGLMVKGRDGVKKIGFAVSASLALFENANHAGCDAIVVHHSFNLPSSNRFDTVFQNRIGYLIKKDISLFGYHFLLDSHPKVGNNVQLLKAIGAKPVKPYMHRGNPWGWTGELDESITIETAESLLSTHFSKHTVLYPFGPKQIKRVVAVSGMGSPVPTVMHDLISQNTDLYITGEVHEWNRELFREAKIHFIAGGHYNTECFGIKALMEYVKKKLPDVHVAWLDLPNEI